MTNRKYDIEDRLIDFSVSIIKLVKTLPKDEIGHYLSNQILRSSVSPALNYGEAQGAESKRDFIHKVSISLKELKETRANLKIMNRAELTVDHALHKTTSKECEELIAILASSINTAKRNS